MKRAVAVLLMIGVLTAGLAGCGKAETTQATDAQTQIIAGEATDVAVSETAAVENGTEEETTEGNSGEVKTVIAAVETGSKPLSFEDEDGNLTGYEVDVLNAINELIPEYEIQIEAVESDATQIGLETGKYALIGGGLYRTPEREEKYLLPDAISGVSTIKIFVNGDNDDIRTLDDLVGKKVSPPSPNGGIYNLLTEYNEEHPDAKIDFETADGAAIADRFTDISNGTYEALVIPDNLGYDEIIKELNLNVKVVEEPVKVNPTYFALAKGQEDLLEKVNTALTTLREDGTLSKLSVRWFGEDKIAYYTE